MEPQGKTQPNLVDLVWYQDCIMFVYYVIRDYSLCECYIHNTYIKNSNKYVLCILIIIYNL